MIPHIVTIVFPISHILTIEQIILNYIWKGIFNNIIPNSIHLREFALEKSLTECAHIRVVSVLVRSDFLDIPEFPLPLFFLLNL